MCLTGNIGANNICRIWLFGTKINCFPACDYNYHLRRLLLQAIKRLMNFNGKSKTWIAKYTTG